MKIIVEPQSSLLANMNDMRIRDAYCDLKFRLPDDTEFPVHKSFAAARSQYFAKMFNSELTDGASNVIDITTFDGETLNIVIDYIYSGSFEFEFSNILRVLHAFELMILPEAVQAIDDCLATTARDHLDEVVGVTASFPNLPLNNDTLAEIICEIHETKRATIIEQATTGTMLKVAAYAGTSINDFFSDTMEWMKRNKDSKDFWRVYSALDFNDIYTSNIKELGMLGAKAAIAEYNSVQLLLDKVTDIIVRGRTGKILVCHDAATLSSYDTEAIEVGSMKWSLTVNKQTNTMMTELCLGIFLNGKPEENGHLESYNCVVVCNFALCRSSGPPKRIAMTHTFTECDVSKGVYMIGWDELLMDSKAFLTPDGKIQIEAEIIIEHSALEWK